MKGKNGMRPEAARGTLDAVWPARTVSADRISRGWKIAPVSFHNMETPVRIRSLFQRPCTSLPAGNTAGTGLALPGATAFLCARVPATGGLSPAHCPMMRQEM